jgi:TorA maturation chaperone TorD
MSADLWLCLDRARVYGTLAQLFRMPDGESIRETRELSLPKLSEALERLAGGPDLIEEANRLCELFEDAGVERLRKGYDAAFDESSGIRCSPMEMDQLGGPPQLELTRTFEIADVGGFYKAFGVEVVGGGERLDHIATELEFMNLLAVKESIALQDEGEGEHSEICRDASRVFLRDHLLRWAPRLGERLAEAGGDPIFSAAGRLLGGFIEFDAACIDAAGAPVHVIDPTGTHEGTAAAT